jgi:hypothetical protein
VARSVPDNEEEHVIIVGGRFEVDPEQRDAFLADHSLPGRSQQK